MGKKLALTGLLCAGLVTGCSTNNLAGNFSGDKNYHKSNGCMEYAIHRRAKYDLSGKRDISGPVKDFGKGIISYKLDAPLSKGEWKNNFYFTTGVLFKDIILGAYAYDALFSGGNGGSGSVGNGGSGSGGDTTVGGFIPGGGSTVVTP